MQGLRLAMVVYLNLNLPLPPPPFNFNKVEVGLARGLRVKRRCYNISNNNSFFLKHYLGEPKRSEANLNL